MSYSLSSARRIAAGAIGASAVAGAMLFGGTPIAKAAPPARSRLDGRPNGAPPRRRGEVAAEATAWAATAAVGHGGFGRGGWRPRRLWPGLRRRL